MPDTTSAKTPSARILAEGVFVNPSPPPAGLGEAGTCSSPHNSEGGAEGHYH
jgi:hypothetical protein